MVQRILMVAIVAVGVGLSTGCEDLSCEDRFCAAMEWLSEDCYGSQALAGHMEKGDSCLERAEGWTTSDVCADEECSELEECGEGHWMIEAWQANDCETGLAYWGL